MSKDNELDIFRKQIEQTNKQGEYILRAVDEIKAIKKDLLNIKEETLTINARTNDRLEDLENTKTLLNGEAKKIKSQVMRRAYLLANKYFKSQVSDELFHKKRIHLQTGIYKKINEHFDAITYTTIRHIDFDDAMNYINSIELVDLPFNYLKLTDKQKEVAEKNNEKVVTLFSVDNREIG
ncbi:ORF6C domain-containing protein [Staphylococcus aureus]|uniref:ORF6C domain-containing protein n=1 Tax=Staphylococcus TaxID=1279 RepID=UPI001F2BC528|nr:MULTISPECIES: ORF6C domain-containing protein [Staphylococcus]MCF7580359.1 ORF6C domain-containing protein [Staphylococcus aureus]MDO0970918.1 ORF6C domain-containing protein [Staphylococcus haemolyticus]